MEIKLNPQKIKERLISEFKKQKLFTKRKLTTIQFVLLFFLVALAIVWAYIVGK